MTRLPIRSHKKISDHFRKVAADWVMDANNGKPNSFNLEYVWDSEYSDWGLRYVRRNSYGEVVFIDFEGRYENQNQ